MRFHGITERARVRRGDDTDRPVQLRVGPHLMSMSDIEAQELADQLHDAVEQEEKSQ